MTDEECLQLLQWAAPRLGLRYRGFRRVKGQVCKRLARRMAELGLATVTDYRALLARDESERVRFDELCRVTISRFYRDHAVWDRLADPLLPELIAAKRLGTLRCWSAGCGSGEEPFTLALLYLNALRPRFPELALDLVATDADPYLLERAGAATFRPATLRELPEEWKRSGFETVGDERRVRPEVQSLVRFERADIRTAPPPPGPLHLLLCRNLVFTYFDEPVQREQLARFATLLVPGGLLVTGAHELFDGNADFERIQPGLPIFRRR